MKLICAVLGFLTTSKADLSEYKANLGDFFPNKNATGIKKELKRNPPRTQSSALPTIFSPKLGCADLGSSSNNCCASNQLN